jgi:quercetin dioxygenase-like cupin family protein
MKNLTSSLILHALLCLTVSAIAVGQDYEKSTAGTRILEGRGGLIIKVLVEHSNLGSDEVEVGEITFPAGSQGGGHRHEAIEIFYVLSGKMNHVVNGEAHVLGPGGVAIVKPGDTVSHEVVGDEPVKALVIWAPGGEAERIASVFEVRPIE